MQYNLLLGFPIYIFGIPGLAPLILDTFWGLKLFFSDLNNYIPRACM